MEWWLKCMKNYFKFSGRARPKEFWMFTVWQLIFIFCFGLVGGFSKDLDLDDSTQKNIQFVVQTGFTIFFWATFFPCLSASVRRLHDTGRSGWALFIAFIPVVGGIIQIIWLAESGSKDDNKYGAPPISDQPCVEPLLQEDDS